MDGSLALGGAGASGGSWSFDDWRERARDTADKAKDYAQNIKQSITPAFLRKNEEAAIDDEAKNDGSLREAENNVLADSASKTKDNAAKIANAVKGVTAAQTGNYGQALSSAKKAGPVLGIIVGLITFGMMMYASDALMPFSLVSHMINEGSTAMETGISRRSDRLLRYQMNPSSRKTNIGGYEVKSIYSPLHPKKFSPTKRQQAKLADKGITFEEVDGTKVMKYKGQTIVSDDSLVDSIPGSKTLKTMLAEGGDFSYTFLEGTMTWRGKVRYWFDTKVGELLLKLRVSRNKTKNSADGDTDEIKRLTVADELEMSKAKLSDELDTSKNDQDEEFVTRKAGQDMEFDIDSSDSEATMRQKIETNVDARAKKMSKVAGTVNVAGAIGNWSCMAVNLASSITSMMRVLQMDQIRQAASTILEVVQKTQIGDNSNELFNTTAGILGKVVTTSYKTGEGNNEITELTGSVSQSNLALSTYEDTPRAPDASVNTLNPMSGLGSFWQSLGNAASSVGGFVTCASIKMAAAAADAVTDAYDLGVGVAEIIACVGGAAVTYGTSCAPLIGHLAVKVAGSIVGAVAISAAVQAITSWLVPKVANMFVRDVASYLTGGHDTGNGLFAAGLSMQLDNYRLGGGTLLTAQTYGGYKKVEEEYIAEKAHYERQSHSPFDPTSEYTFMGSLLSKVGILATSMSSPVTALSALGSTALSSASALLPHASAVSAAEKAEYLEKFTEKYCPNLSGIGALARDGYCTPLMGEDFSTIDTDPLAVIESASTSSTGGQNFEEGETEEGMPIIKQDSDLMRYILAVPERQSEFGVADQNLANSYDLIQNGTAASAAGAVPILGGVLDIINNGTALNHIGYISGRAGVIKNDGSELGSSVSVWDKIKSYQRFISDQRILEAIGVIRKSSVTSALEKYYEEHPLDNSFEGILARKTGMTKENVIATLDFIKLAMFVNDYEPASYYPYIAIEKEAETIDLSDDGIDAAPYALPIFDDRSQFIVRKEYNIA